jgi:ribosomal protein L30/L7E
LIGSDHFHLIPNLSLVKDFHPANGEKKRTCTMWTSCAKIYSFIIKGKFKFHKKTKKNLIYLGLKSIFKGTIHTERKRVAGEEVGDFYWSI